MRPDVEIVGDNSETLLNIYMISNRLQRCDTYMCPATYYSNDGQIYWVQHFNAFHSNFLKTFSSQAVEYESADGLCYGFVDSCVLWSVV